MQTTKPREISYNTAPGSLRLDVGYGQAGFQIVSALKRMGLSVPYNDKHSKVQFNFSQPEWATKRNTQHSIMYTPWESSVLPGSWATDISIHDEFWTTSPWCKEVFEANGVRVDKVFMHGVADIWAPIKRTPRKILRFLSNAEPSPRKGGQMAFDAFRAAFGDQDDVQLTIKAYATNTVRVKNSAGSIIAPITDIKNVVVDTRVLTTEELVRYYQDHHVFVGNSFGEGFGLPAIQAIGTGMPAIVTEAWCAYAEHTLPLKSELIDSPWDFMHPGQVFKPDFDQLVWWYQELYNNYDKYSAQFYKNAPVVHEIFNWDTLTQEAFADILEKL